MTSKEKTLNALLMLGLGGLRIDLSVNLRVPFRNAANCMYKGGCASFGSSDIV